MNYRAARILVSILSGSAVSVSLLLCLCLSLPTSPCSSCLCAFLEFLGICLPGYRAGLWEGDWPGRKPRLAGRPLRGESLFHASPPGEAGYQLHPEGDTSGARPPTIPSLWRVSQASQSHTQPAAAGPHLALAQGMRACMLSQGGDSWALALQEMGWVSST